VIENIIIVQHFCDLSLLPPAAVGKKKKKNDGHYQRRQGKKRMAEKKKKKGVKLRNEGNRTQVSTIKCAHLTTTLHLLLW